MAARMAWSSDGRYVFLANEESDSSSVIKIDVSNPMRLQPADTDGTVNYVWSVAHRGSMLVFSTSIGDWVIRYDAKTFKPIWHRKVGTSHTIETDGSRIFIPLEGKPGRLIVLDSSGRELARVLEPEGWYQVFTSHLDESAQRLYIGAGDRIEEGYPGGVYVYDIRQSVPVLLGRIGGSSWDFAVTGRKVWRRLGGVRANILESWDVSDPSRPRKTGEWVGAEVIDTRDGSRRKPALGHMTANRAGTRLYVAYDYSRFASWMPAGFHVFDVSGTNPRLIHTQFWKLPDNTHMVPVTSLELSPDETTIAVSYFFFGVRLYRITGDQAQPLGALPTVAEARDVYVDNAGYIHCFCWNQMIVLDPMSREIIGYLATPLVSWDGSWIPFLDGTVLVHRQVLRLQNGRITWVATLDVPEPSTANLFEEGLLFTAAGGGFSLSVYSVGSWNGRTYPLTFLGQEPLPKAPRASAQLKNGRAFALTKSGNLVWAVGPEMGVVAVDVSNPRDPRVVYHDPFTFETSGHHMAIVARQGRVYVGAGAASLRIYDETLRRHVHTVPGLNVNFLDIHAGRYLLVSNYWYPPNPTEWGMYVYDLDSNPTIPSLVRTLKWGANFRARSLNGLIYRVPLYGVDIIDP